MIQETDFNQGLLINHALVSTLTFLLYKIEEFILMAFLLL